MMLKQLLISSLTLLTTTATVNIPLIQSAVAQTSSVVNINNTKIAGGSTTTGATNWQPYLDSRFPNTIYVDVNTSGANFTNTPKYATSIGGTAYLSLTTGGSAILLATPKGFRVYVRFSDGRTLTPALANQYQWHINWMSIGI